MFRLYRFTLALTMTAALLGGCFNAGEDQQDGINKALSQALVLAESDYGDEVAFDGEAEAAFAEEALDSAQVDCDIEGVMAGVWLDDSTIKGFWVGLHGAVKGSLEGTYFPEECEGCIGGRLEGTWSSKEGAMGTFGGTYADNALLALWDQDKGADNVVTVMHNGEMGGMYHRLVAPGGYFFGLWTSCDTLPDNEPPKASCEVEECGPELGMPNVLCDDGVTMAGPTGRCLLNEDDTCGWEVVTCH